MQLKAANGSEGHRSKGAAATDTTRQKSKDDAKESLGRLDGLWDALLSSLGFVIPLLKEVSMTRLLCLLLLSFVTSAMVFGRGAWQWYAFPGDHWGRKTEGFDFLRCFVCSPFPLDTHEANAPLMRRRFA